MERGLMGDRGATRRMSSWSVRARALRTLTATLVTIGAVGSGLIVLWSAPASAAPPAPTWATGQYFDAIQNVPFCDDVSISNSAALPLTSITVGSTPSGFTNYRILNVNLTA